MADQDMVMQIKLEIDYNDFEEEEGGGNTQYITPVDERYGQDVKPVAKGNSTEEEPGVSLHSLSDEVAGHSFDIMQNILGATDCVKSNSDRTEKLTEGSSDSLADVGGARVEYGTSGGSLKFPVTSEYQRFMEEYSRITSVHEGDTETGSGINSLSPSKNSVYPFGASETTGSWGLPELTRTTSDLGSDLESSISQLSRSSIIASALSGGQFRCDVCSEGFSLLSQLQMHRMTHASGSLNFSEEKPVVKEKKYQCDECDSSFAGLGNLKIHKRVHTGEKPYACTECDAKFARGHDLNRHAKIHTGERPHICDICHAQFSDTRYLKLHLRTHSGERPFQCDVCQQRFTQVSSLKVHKRKHTGERPYECEFCGTSFIQLQDVIRHRRTHTGERPFKCDVCDASFIEGGHLKRHKRRHTGEKPYKCELCDKRFAHASSLKYHYGTHPASELSLLGDVAGIGGARSPAEVVRAKKRGRKARLAKAAEEKMADS
ncbi:zinc finger protein 79 [Aplysia californica]|uniref:Zinc finger protein 79 n=1 Tax=Aplysia californica TaxID=6500 RepID=A0ABM0K822_APLCA|nr:zinc finger protein 79 [Aplysia californica]XP_012944982.1 zinc finger protein 79 [Aplysia californica]